MSKLWSKRLISGFHCIKTNRPLVFKGWFIIWTGHDRTVSRQNRPNKVSMAFAISFPPAILGSVLQLSNYEFFILKHRIDQLIICCQKYQN